MSVVHSRSVSVLHSCSCLVWHSSLYSVRHSCSYLVVHSCSLAVWHFCSTPAVHFFSDTGRHSWSGTCSTTGTWISTQSWRGWLWHSRLYLTAQVCLGFRSTTASWTTLHTSPGSSQHFSS